MVIYFASNPSSDSLTLISPLLIVSSVSACTPSSLEAIFTVPAFTVMLLFECIPSSSLSMVYSPFSIVISTPAFIPFLL